MLEAVVVELLVVLDDELVVFDDELVPVEELDELDPPATPAPPLPPASAGALATPIAATNATAVEQTVRRSPGCDTANPSLIVPTGLAVGLALKESRYAGVRRFAPSAAVALMGSPFPGRRIGRGFGWVIFGRAAYINRKINVTAGVMTPRVAMISGARAGLNGDADTPAHARVFDQRAASACGSGGSLRPRQSAAGGQRGEDCRMQPRRRRRRCGDGRGAGAAGLAARRHGCRVTLRGASVELRQLLEFPGLWPVLGG